MRGLHLTFVVLTIFIFLVPIARADVQLPGSVQGGVIGNGLENQQPISAAQSVTTPVLTSPKPASSLLSEKVKKITFQLNGIILEGNHVYSTAQLQVFYQQKLHKTITVGELFDILQEITNYYRNNGYILTRAILPPQKVDKGIVKIQIIEGYIGKVTVAGTPRGAKCIVQQFGNRIKQCPPLEVSRMEKYLLLANEIPGTQVKSQLSPSKAQSGAADLVLITKNSPVTGYISYDNYGTRYIGPQDLTGSIAFNSFIISGDATQFTLTKTPKGGELSFFDLNYSIPVNDNGARWLMDGNHTHTHPLFVLRPSQIDGITKDYYTIISFPIIRTLSKSLTLRSSFYYFDTHVTTLNTNLYTDHIRTLDLGVTYNFADQWKGSNLINADLRQGLPILGYTSNRSPAAQTSRPGATGNYIKLAAQVSRIQLIKGAFSLYGIIEGQWAPTPLLSSEQFVFGGSQLGRGYDLAELISDKGAAGSLELRCDITTKGVLQFLQSLQLYTFYDAGIAWNYKYVGGVPRKLSGTSTGFGARFNFTKYLSGNAMWTQTLTKQVAAEKLIGEGKRPRAFMSLVASFGY